MGRPKRVIFEKFGEYNLLHTKKTKMYSGVSINILYPMKETEQYYRSVEVWASCASHFKIKKKNISKLEVNISEVTNPKTIEFLNENCWKDWVDKNKDNSDFKEISTYLKKIYPNKELVYFYELDSLIHSYLHGTYVRYDENGNIEAADEHDMKNRKYYNHKYNTHRSLPPNIQTLRDEYHNETDKQIKQEKFDKYYNAEQDYVYSNMCLDDIFIDICENAVCYPVAFSKGTAEWSKEKYGKEIAYAKAGEIYFVTTSDKVFFNKTRHF